MFVSIRDVLRYYNDTHTIALRLSTGSAAFGLNRTNIANIPSGFTRIYSEILHELVKNTPKASTNHKRIKDIHVFVSVLDNS